MNLLMMGGHSPYEASHKCGAWFSQMRVDVAKMSMESTIRALLVTLLRGYDGYRISAQEMEISYKWTFV